MAGLVPAIHVSTLQLNSWMPGTSAGHDEVVCAFLFEPKIRPINGRRSLFGTGRGEDRERGGYHQGLPQARQEAASGPQSGRQGGRGEVQEDRRRLRHRRRRGQARALRPRRDRRVRPGDAAAALLPRICRRRRGRALSLERRLRRYRRVQRSIRRFVRRTRRGHARWRRRPAFRHARAGCAISPRCRFPRCRERHQDADHAARRRAARRHHSARGYRRPGAQAERQGQSGRRAKAGPATR